MKVRQIPLVLCMAHRLICGLTGGLLGSGYLLTSAVEAQPYSVAPVSPHGHPATTARDLGLDEAVLQNSPVLQRWLERPPDLLGEIRHTPALPTRVQILLEGTSAWNIGIQDLRLSNRLTLSGDYRQSFEQPQDTQYGSRLRYYLAPLGSMLNLAPQVGYHRIGQGERSLSGWQYGAFAVFALAPRAADLTASYSLLTPSEDPDSQATLADITAAYAISPSFRLGARYGWQHSTLRRESHFGVILEWVP